MSQCEAITKSGEQCSRTALEGSVFCGIHKEESVKGSDVEQKSELPDVKNVIRYISKSGKNVGASIPIGDVDEYLSFWTRQGYVLIDTHYLGENPEGYGVLYILAR